MHVGRAPAADVADASVLDGDAVGLSAAAPRVGAFLAAADGAFAVGSEDLAEHGVGREDGEDILAVVFEARAHVPDADAVVQGVAVRVARRCAAAMLVAVGPDDVCGQVLVAA